MKILITGICGFVGSTLARGMREAFPDWQISGLDCMLRSGSELNLEGLRKLGIVIHHADIRQASDLEHLPAADWVIDAAANPSVLAGMDGLSSSRQLMEHNLWGTVNILEYCRRHKAGFILLSTSRVYSIKPLAEIPMTPVGDAFQPDSKGAWPDGLSERGVNESFSTQPPISLYGSSKAASETLAREYGEAFGFPVWINRCGVLAGAGQFGRADQGIFAFWINAWLRGRPLKYIGFNGGGHQVRDALHPLDLLPLLKEQFQAPRQSRPSIINLGGGVGNAMSLTQLSNWCKERFGPREVKADLTPRPFDIPWMVMDASLAGTSWGWSPQRTLPHILEEIAVHAEKNPRWLEITGS